MARGFESKDVEFQQSEAERAKPKSPALSAAEHADLVRRQTIEMSLTRARSELARAASAAHRRMLEQAIADLERQLASSTPTAMDSGH
jgi:hypothetical protein